MPKSINKTVKSSSSFYSKGRQVNPKHVNEIQTLLADRPLARDFLIENLHLIQDQFKQISTNHLAALADLMKLSMAEVYEVATFYHHFAC